MAKNSWAEILDFVVRCFELYHMILVAKEIPIDMFQIIKAAEPSESEYNMHGLNTSARCEYAFL